MERCTAHKEENLQVSKMLNVFLDTHDVLQSWLINTADAFLRGHQDMGSDLTMAHDFSQVHRQLLFNLENKREEVDHLALEILPIIERLDESQKHELRSKIKHLEDSWTKTKIIIEKRVELSRTYIEFHEIIEELTNEMGFIENELKKHEPALNDTRIAELERKWESLEFLYNELDNRGKAYLNEASKVT